MHAYMHTHTQTHTHWKHTNTEQTSIWRNLRLHNLCDSIKDERMQQILACFSHHKEALQKQGSESFKSAALSKTPEPWGAFSTAEVPGSHWGQFSPPNVLHTTGWDPEATSPVFNCHATKSRNHAPPPPPHPADFWGRYKYLPWHRDLVRPCNQFLQNGPSGMVPAVVTRLTHINQTEFGRILTSRVHL